VLLDLDVKMVLEHLSKCFAAITTSSLRCYNTGNDNGRVLDEHLAGAFMLRDGRISRLSTFMSDISNAENVVWARWRMGRRAMSSGSTPPVIASTAFVGGHVYDRI
jgi:hypothetical protein